MSRSDFCFIFSALSYVFYNFILSKQKINCLKIWLETSYYSGLVNQRGYFFRIFKYFNVELSNKNISPYMINFDV